MAAKKRLDREGSHRAAFDRNRIKIYATQTICGICGNPVDMSLKAPDPMSKTIDHIIPVSRGGHPSDIDNLQLAHRICNEKKNNKLPGTVINGINVKGNTGEIKPIKQIGNDDLPLLMDWGNYKPS